MVIQTSGTFVQVVIQQNLFNIVPFLYHPRVNSVFHLRNDAGIVCYICILRLQGCPGLLKIKFGGVTIGDERLPGASPPPPRSSPRPRPNPVSSTCCAPRGVPAESKQLQIGSECRPRPWRLRFGLLVWRLSKVEAHAGTRQLSSWQMPRWGSSCREVTHPGPRPRYTISTCKHKQST
jgi:hypothetical protein